MIRKVSLLLTMAVLAVLAGNAQKFALIDMEYILKNVPSYEMANEQLNQLSQRWQKEVEVKGKEAEQMYQTYLADKVFLTEDQAKAREQQVVDKEAEATQLRYTYFGPEGELYKKRQTLLKPIQDEIYNAIKKLAQKRGLHAIFDRSSSGSIVFASPAIDVSNDVLAEMGYAK